MPRARTDPIETAAAYAPNGSGCLSGYVLPPLAVLIVGTLLAIFALNVAPGDLNAQAAAPGTPAETLPLDSAVAAALSETSRPTGTSIEPPAQNGEATLDALPTQLSPPPPAPILQMFFPDTSAPAAPAVSGTISSVFTPSIQYWSESITRWATSAGLDPNLAATVMQIESCGDASATSRAGAIGLFQVMPYHFADDDSPYDPNTNAARGLNYLRRSLTAAHEDARLAFAGYNGGIGVISRSEWSWPEETVRYAFWGSGIYADAVAGNLDSARLDEWLTAGGSSMCARAALRLGLGD
jgi:soluble lytic murein transglycosylase-like protein